MLQSSSAQVHNLACFMAGEFSWNQDTLINNHLQNEKKNPAEKNLLFFLLETLRNCILNDKFNP